MEESSNPTITISIVSHNQISLVEKLLNDIEKYCQEQIEVILTLNLPETINLDIKKLSFPLTIIANDRPKGFGANHNAAFQKSHGKYYCILNPDIRFIDDPFPELLACYENNVVGVAAPIVVNSEGQIEDNARAFPTPFAIIKKAIFYKKGEHIKKSDTIKPDWLAGMFMLFDSSVFDSINGFDERYFLYYEDVDLCARLSLAGYDIRQCPETRVVHDAQRESHRKLKYFLWHLSSMARFFMSRVFFKILLR